MNKFYMKNTNSFFIDTRLGWLSLSLLASMPLLLVPMANNASIYEIWHLILFCAPLFALNFRANSNNHLNNNLIAAAPYIWGLIAICIISSVMNKIVFDILSILLFVIASAYVTFQALTIKNKTKRTTIIAIVIFALISLSLDYFAQKYYINSFLSEKSSYSNLGQYDLLLLGAILSVLNTNSYSKKILSIISTICALLYSILGWLRLFIFYKAQNNASLTELLINITYLHWMIFILLTFCLSIICICLIKQK